jgi:RNA polymerase sigma-70 factor (ECF subfamily)
MTCNPDFARIHSNAVDTLGATLAPGATTALGESAGSRRKAFDAARGDWPTGRLTFEAYSRHLERLGYAEKAPPGASDLYLCAACLSGDGPAIRALEEAHFPALRRSLRGYLRNADLVEELLQELRERLLVGRHPRLARYRGRGALRAWLKTTVRRAATDHLRARRRSMRALEESAMAESPATLGDWISEEEHDVDDIGKALASALRSLPTADRRLVRAFYVDASPVERLCQGQSLHRATVYRRLRRCESLVRRKLREQVRRSTGTTDDEELDTLLTRVPAVADLSGIVRQALLD